MAVVIRAGPESTTSSPRPIFTLEQDVDFGEAIQYTAPDYPGAVDPDRAAVSAAGRGRTDLTSCSCRTASPHLPDASV